MLIYIIIIIYNISDRFYIVTCGFVCIYHIYLVYVPVMFIMYFKKVAKVVILLSSTF